MQKYSIPHDEISVRKCPRQKNRFNSLFTTMLPLFHHYLSFTSHNNEYFEYSYVQTNGSITPTGTNDSTVKLLKSNLILITKSNLYDTMKQLFLHKVS